MRLRRNALATLGLSALALLLSVPLAGLMPETPMPGSITGTITYDDQVPLRKPLALDINPECAALHSSPVYSDRLVLGDGNTLGNVFVRIKNAPRKDYPTPSAPVVIDQKGCFYVPHVVGVMVGQPLQFKNSDGILHNVHGLPKVNREFNLGMPPTLKEKEMTFDKPEPIFKVKCDVHPWMNSYVAVMTHPYFAVTGQDGTFSIDNLPDGAYEIEAWHERLGTQTKQITLKNGKATVDFYFKRPER